MNLSDRHRTASDNILDCALLAQSRGKFTRDANSSRRVDIVFRDGRFIINVRRCFQQMKREKCARH